MRKIIFLLIATPLISFSQPNCTIYDGDCANACEIATRPAGKQGSRSSQEKFNRAIELCPDKIAYFYMEQAVPYLKRGDFVTWKKLIDKAVEIDPIGQLGYRGWCRLQFLRDYEGAINDIELLDSLSIADIGYSQNGHYHLYTALALCYKKIGKLDKSIAILEQHVGNENYEPWAFEYLHLGVMKYEKGDMVGAKDYLLKQLSVGGELAETHYYMALVNKKMGIVGWKDHLRKSEKLYLEEKKLIDVYCTPVDKIYLADIQNELAIQD